MQTEIIREDMARAAAIIRAGGLVAVPTETVYGLAGDGLNEAVVRAIYEVKGRPEVKPLSLMVPDASAIERYCADAPPAAKALAERFWPGPLTIVLRSKETVPEIVRAGGETVALRCPDHPLTLEALRLAQRPFAAPSANPSGLPSPKTAGQVLDYFDGRIDAVIDGGPCGLGRESTILDMSGTPYRVLRQGALPEKEIADMLADRLRLVGITGGSGSGKTTALEVLRARGALIVDCDVVYHALLETDKELVEELERSFPGVTENGKLLRRRLGAIVFSDADALKRLNAITHSHIGAAVRERLRAFAMAGGSLAALDAVELISSGLAAQCDFTVGVLADRETRIQRIMARDGIGREYAEKRIDAQRSDAYFTENCTVTLENNGDFSDFTARFEQILEERLQNG